MYAGHATDMCIRANVTVWQLQSSVDTFCFSTLQLKDTPTKSQMQAAITEGEQNISDNKEVS